jgi:parallel beta-helix repeat protein
MLTLAFSIQPVKASGTIYIRAEGNIDPPAAPILSLDNVTYTFLGNIGDSIIVERDNIVVDGAGYTLQGSGVASAIILSGRTNVTIENIEIKTFHEGIFLQNSSDNNLSNNTITDSENGFGILLVGSSNNSISRNSVRLSTYAIPEPTSIGISILLSSNYSIITENTIENTFEAIGIQESSSNRISGNTLRGNYYGIGVVDSKYTDISENTIRSGETGIDLERCSDNLVSRNNITENNYDGITLYPQASSNALYENYIMNNNRGIILWEASYNSIYNNNFVNNSQQVYIITSGYNNSWINGYPSGGNYWSNYNGIDLYRGIYQNETGSDGIGDSPYIMDAENVDHYPLMELYTRLLGDVNHDRRINIKDVALAVLAFNSFPGSSRWNPDADIDNSGHVDMRDLVLIVLNFNKHE